MAKSSLKRGKSAGADGTPQRFSSSVTSTAYCCTSVTDFYWKTLSPKYLSTIISVPKSSDLAKPGNYPGIRMTSSMAKLSNRMILNWIQDTRNPHLREKTPFEREDLK